jgi:hypothetical protein
MIFSEGRTMRRGYQIVFVHSFEDAWDLELETIEARVEAIARHDPEAAASAVSSGRAELSPPGRERSGDPRIAAYLRP